MRQPAGVSGEVRGLYAGLIDALTRDGHPELGRDCAALAVTQQIWADPLQRPVEYLPGASAQPVYDPAGFWFVEHLESSYPKIRAELDAVVDPRRHGFLPVEEPLLDAGTWDQVVLYEAGRRQDAACAAFPVLADVVEQIPEATTLGPGVVTLSWLNPGAHIVPHCGRTNGQLRVHLGLRVPPGAELRVGAERLRWQEGRCIVFDDSFEHEVWHDGTEPRIVLLLDVLYPGLDEARRERILAERRSAVESITAFLLAHDLRRIESDDRGAMLRPAPATEALVRRYMTETGARAVELRDGRPHFERG